MKQAKHAFPEYVKTPDLFHQEALEQTIADSAPPPAPEEVAALVSDLGRRRLTGMEIQKLKNGGRHAASLLQTALRDERFLLHRYFKSGLDNTLLNTALEILEPYGLPAASILEPALRNPDECIRYRTLHHLARCGNDDAIAALTVGLNSPSEHCRTWTLMGLEYLKDSPRASVKFRAALFDAAAPLLADAEYYPADHAPRALLALDAERAKRVLLQPDVLCHENKHVHGVLAALRAANVAVPSTQLRGLLAGIKQLAVRFPYDRAYATGLILLAHSEGASARDLIDDARRWGGADVREGAAEALGIVVGVCDVYRFVCSLYERDGANALSEAQQYYLTLAWLDAEVRNGGFSQYYFNSAGELASYAVPAARAVGASDLAAIIYNANMHFGKDGPSADRNSRMEQLSKIDLGVLEDLDRLYFSHAEHLGELLAMFVASNPAAFKPAT